MAANFNSLGYDLASRSGGQNGPAKVDITIAMFFDGTLNNKWNTEARYIYEAWCRNTPETDANGAKYTTIEGHKVYYKKDSDGQEYIEVEGAIIYKDEQTAKKIYVSPDSHDGDSYENSYSNVSRLFNNVIDKEYAIYIDGIGTIKHKNDHTFTGGGLGDGETGIEKRVQLACRLAVEKIQSLKRKVGGSKISKITFDVFGFSRGAAAARHFASVIHSRKGVYMPRTDPKTGTPSMTQEDMDDQKRRCGYFGYYLKQNGIDLLEETDIQVEIRFAGLLDTVSTHGVVYYNDKFDLKLNEISKAKKILHLTANDEHRAKFTLTKIISEPTALEFGLPGVHSDIGGCYAENMIEGKMELFDGGYWSTQGNLTQTNNEKNRLIEQGWFKDRDCNVNINTNILMCGRSHGLSNRYSYIPLHLICKFINGEMVDYPGWKTELITVDGKHKGVIVDFSKIKINCMLPKGNVNLSTDLQKLQKSIVDKGIRYCTLIQASKANRHVGSIGQGPAPQSWKVIISDSLDDLLMTKQYEIKIAVDDLLKFAMQYLLTNYSFNIRRFPKCKTIAQMIEKYSSKDDGFDAFCAEQEQFHNMLTQQIYIRELRYRCLHWSAKESLSGVHNANIINGVRERKIV